MEWKEDILGKGFECTIIPLEDDYAGKVEATLIRKTNIERAETALLYIHGFNDYFFQTELADNFAAQGYHFYALDLRRYGRSFKEYQKFNDIRDLKSYNEEILKAISIIKSNNTKRIVLMGHSTGGLIATLFAKEYTGKNLIAGVILNSPFYDFNMSSWLLGKLIPTAALIGKVLPNIEIAGALSKEYGESLHQDYDGEWNYILEWKPNTPPPISLGWLRAIRNGHQDLKQAFEIAEPVLVLHSSATITDKFDKEQMHSMDAVLSVSDIEKTAKKIKGKVIIETIKEGMHDLILSRKDVREHTYDVMMKWMKIYF